MRFSYIALDERNAVKHRALVVLSNVMTHDKFAAEEIVKSEIFDILTGYASQKVQGLTPVIIDLACDILKLLVTERFVEETDTPKVTRGSSGVIKADEEIGDDSGEDYDDDLLA